ncbi:unnamed protein product, partial [Ranitomeya imitator]
MTFYTPNNPPALNYLYPYGERAVINGYKVQKRLHEILCPPNAASLSVRSFCLFSDFREQQLQNMKSRRGRHNQCHIQPFLRPVLRFSFCMGSPHSPTADQSFLYFAMSARSSLRSGGPPACG